MNCLCVRWKYRLLLAILGSTLCAGCGTKNVVLLSDANRSQTVSSSDYVRIKTILRGAELPSSAKNVSLYATGFQDTEYFLAFQIDPAELSAWTKAVTQEDGLIDVQSPHAHWTARPSPTLVATFRHAANDAPYRFRQVMKGFATISGGRYFEDGSGLYIAIDSKQGWIFLRK